eukprot:1612696-Alexandrium_andersonii.AAC.1
MLIFCLHACFPRLRRHARGARAEHVDHLGAGEGFRREAARGGWVRKLAAQRVLQAGRVPRAEGQGR